MVDRFLESRFVLGLRVGSWGRDMRSLLWIFALPPEDYRGGRLTIRCPEGIPVGEPSASGAPWLRQGRAGRGFSESTKRSSICESLPWQVRELSPAAPCLHLPTLAVQGGAGTSGQAWRLRQDSLAAAGRQLTLATRAQAAVGFCKLIG